MADLLHALRRQPTRYAWPVLLGLSLAFFFSRGLQFQGNWLWTADWSAGVVFLTGPLAAAVAAWQARFQRVHMAEAAAMSPRLRGTSILMSGQTALILSVQLVLLATGIVLSAVKNPHPDSMVHFLVVLPILVGYVGFGVLAGTAFPYLATAPAAAVSAYVLASSSTGLLPTTLTRFGGATADLTGLQPRTTFELGHAAFGLGLGGAALVGGTWIVSRRRPSVTVLILGALAVVLTGSSFAYFESTNLDRFGTRPVRPACLQQRGLTLCVTETEQFQLAPVLRELASIDSIEKSVGTAGLPSRFNAAVGSKLAPYRANAAERPLDIGDLPSAHGAVARFSVLLRTVLLDARCLDNSMTTDLSRASADLDLAGDLIILRLVASPSIEAVPGMDELLAQPRAHQDEWLRSVLTAANACQLGTMPAPPRS